MIVIPMAGQSSRFFRAGYEKPKYMLVAHGKTLFEHSVESFKQYFKTIPFLFVIRDEYGTEEFVINQAVKLGIVNFKVVVLTELTKGQAETVYQGLKNTNWNGAVTIFNIDTFRRDFQYPDFINNSDGYLEVFEGEGDNWSFARLADSGKNEVLETSEKRPISRLCSTGLYYFASVEDYYNAYEHYNGLPSDSWEAGELYIAPLYNFLIEKGERIKVDIIEEDQVVFCGTPDEYSMFLNLGS